MTHRRTAAVIVCLVLVLAGAGRYALSQSTTATLRGKVIDSDGAGLPGVPVTVTSRSRSEARKTAMTDVDGVFKFVLLPPAGDYYLSVSYPGFSPTEVGPIDLDPGKTTVQDVTLRTTEELTQRVEVVAHGSVVDTETAKTSTTFNTEFIEGLPIIGRNYQDILTLTPGVTDTDGDGNPNVQGARATGLQYRLDGGNITDPASGTFGQTLNFDAIEEIEVIVAGASAEYGRADGGFANIITKSGSNDFEGSFKLYWRGKILDNDGAGENQDTFFTHSRVENDLRRTSPYLTLGGALKRDRLWYFVSMQYLDRVDPINLAGATITQKVVGHNSFAKLTWQANSDNKLALQYNDDPYTYEGLFLDFGVETESDATFSKSGVTPQLRWTSIISPTLLMEALITHFDQGYTIVPISSRFHTTHLVRSVVRNGNQTALQARFPVEECSVDGTIQGFITNCDPTKGNPSIYQFNDFTGLTSGPYPNKADDDRRRNAIKADLTYTIEEALGEHQLKAGMEFEEERYLNQPINNPYFVNEWEECRACRDLNGQPQPDAIQGYNVLYAPTPVTLEQRAVSFNSGAYFIDTWKPRQNLTLMISARIDNEDIDASGFNPFEPRAEKRRFIGTVDALCTDADRVRQAGGQSNWSQTCDPRSGFVPGAPPVANLIYAMDAGTPERIRRYDRNEDGVFDSGADGPVWYDPLTTFPDRKPQNFEIKNLNLAPRFNAVWDPWADGKTKFYATWGRYFDRLYLDTTRYEQGPDTVSFVFEPDPLVHRFLPNQISRSVSAVSVFQVDRGMRTPHNDAFTLGFERELAPEWSIRFTFTQKLYWDLLQDVDVNHVLCTQHDEEFGLDPRQICALYTDARGRVHLSDDLFGTIDSKSPNRAPDLYIVNPNFNQVFRIGNFNSAKYRSISLEANKRLHRNWQLQGSYTWSRAIGDAEDFVSGLGDDPSTVDDERGYLDYDQRHRVILILVSHLPKDVEIGGTLAWEGGTPFSVIAVASDEDNVGNVNLRTFFPTRSRNDQRNGNFWGLDLQLTKRFTTGKVQSSALFAVKNLLNMDDATLSAYRISSSSGVRLLAGPQGLRRFGRFWELGMTFNF